MRLSITMVLFLIFSGLAHAGEKWDYQLSEKTLFEKGSEANFCERLIIHDRFVAWVTRLTEAGPLLVFKICSREQPLDEGKESNGRIEGSVRAGWYELKKENPFYPQKLVVPRMNDFSNPSFCQSLMAYWGAGQDNAYHPMVYNLLNRTVLKSRFIGRAALGSDYKYVLKPAEWSRDCSAVKFEDTHFRTKIRFKFPVKPQHRAR